MDKGEEGLDQFRKDILCLFQHTHIMACLHSYPLTPRTYDFLWPKRFISLFSLAPLTIRVKEE